MLSEISPLYVLVPFNLISKLSSRYFVSKLYDDKEGRESFSFNCISQQDPCIHNKSHHFRSNLCKNAVVGHPLNYTVLHL